MFVDIIEDRDDGFDIGECFDVAARIMPEETADDNVDISFIDEFWNVFQSRKRLKVGKNGPIEGLVEQIFHLPHNLVKIINPVAGDLFRDLVKQPPKDEPCGIIHDGRTESGLRAMLGAFILDEKFRLTEILSYIGVGLNVLLLAVLSFFSGLAQAGTLEVVVFELVWMAIMMLLPKIKKI